MKTGKLLKCFVLLLAVSSLCAFSAGCAQSGKEGQEGTAGPGKETAEPGTQTDGAARETEKPTEATQTPVPEPEEQGAEKWIRLYEEKYGRGSSEKVLADAKAIEDFNAELVNTTDYMEDIGDFDRANAVTAEQLRAWVEDGSLPNPCYKESGGTYSEEEIAAIDRNRNADAVQGNAARRGVVTDRADLRTVPFGEMVLKAEDDTYYDRIQETELIAGMPVWILHESADGEFYYVQSYYYRGWVAEAKVAVIEKEEDWDLFVKPEKFAVVTDAMLSAGGRSLDMGARFALEETTATGYSVILPGRDADGRFVREKAELPLAGAREGYLPFTMQNYYIQAFRYEGTMYGYGGMDGGVDCSSYICSVFRSFGFMLPRNSGQQGTAIPNAESLSGLDSAGKEAVLAEVKVPTIIYRPGHVVLWLGEENGACRIIQAPQGGETVQEGTLSLSDDRLASVILIGK